MRRIFLARLYQGESALAKFGVLIEDAAEGVLRDQENQRIVLGGLDGRPRRPHLQDGGLAKYLARPQLRHHHRRLAFFGPDIDADLA